VSVSTSGGVTYETLESGSVSTVDWIVNGTRVSQDPTHNWTDAPLSFSPAPVVEVDTRESDRYTIDDTYPRVFRVTDIDLLCTIADAAALAVNKGKTGRDIIKTVYGCDIHHNDAGRPVVTVETDQWAFTESAMDDFEVL